jgi:hypothetical protein
MGRLEKISEQIPALFEKVISEAKPENITSVIRLLAQIDSETERQIYVEKTAKKFKIKPSVILKDIKKLSRPDVHQNKKVVADLPGLVDIVLNSDNEICFLMNGLILTTEKSIKIDGVDYIPPSPEDLPFALPRAEYVMTYHRKYFEEKDDLIINNKLYGDILKYFKRFSYLRESELQIVVLYVFLTYIADHPDVHYLLVLLFCAVPERGKTRTGKAFIYTARRGIHQPDLREANLFRYLRSTT